MALYRWSPRTEGVARISLASVVVLGLLLSLGSGAVVAQATHQFQAAAQSFEVASVKPNDSGDFSLVGVRVLPGGSVVASNVSLRTLIGFAYGLDTYDGIQGRSSLLDRSFDVMAKAAEDLTPAPPGTVGALNVMMQNLLAERFNLVVRVDERPQQGYALVRAAAKESLGSGLWPSDLTCPRRPGASSQIPGDTRTCRIRVSNNELRADGHDMSALARALSGMLRRPVVDRTGLSGSFEVRMTFDQEQLVALMGVQPGAREGVASSLPPLFTALEEQLGLKLEPERVPGRVVIVEHVEPPTPD